MDIRPLASTAAQSPLVSQSTPGRQPTVGSPALVDPEKLTEEGIEKEKLQEAFTDFVGQTLFGSMLASMRKTVGKPAYMHGGRTEEVFQKQLDQIMVEQLTDASASEIAEPMFELFQMQRRA